MEVKYILYTAAEVRAWLYKGIDNGLSEQIISKVRANAIIHNPYITDNMIVVVAAKDGAKVVGYTAMFPDYLIHPHERLTVPTTLYAHPDYASEFIGYNVTKLLHDTSEGRYVIGTDMAKEAALIDRLLGLEVKQLPRNRYVFRRNIQLSSIRCVVSFVIEPFRRLHQKFYIYKLQKKKQPNTIHVQYTNFIDAEAYQFICENSRNDMFLRSQKMLNWLIRNPFSVDAIIYDNIVETNIFVTQLKDWKWNTVKVYDGDVLIGLFAIRSQNDMIDIMMLYTSKHNEKSVYLILLKHIIKLRPKQVRSIYKSLNTFICQTGVALKQYTEKYIFTYPKSLKIDLDKQMQGMDGDMFA